MGMGIISVCLPTYKPLFNLLIPRIKAKWSGSDTVGFVPESPNLEGVGGETGDVEAEGGERGEGAREKGRGGDGDGEKGDVMKEEVVERKSASEEKLEHTERNKKRPSQSEQWRHIGVLGSSLDLETGPTDPRASNTDTYKTPR